MRQVPCVLCGEPIDLDTEFSASQEVDSVMGGGAAGRAHDACAMTDGRANLSRRYEQIDAAFPGKL